MITKDELKAAHERILAERRKQYGPPPTDDELIAFATGELSAADTERVRQGLLAYPELAPAVTEPFDMGDPLPGDADYMSDAEITAHWKALQASLHPDEVAPAARRGNVVPFYRNVMVAVAATLALSFGALLWQMRAAAMLDASLMQPVPGLEEQELPSSDVRGPQAIQPLDAKQQQWRISFYEAGTTVANRYRIAIAKSGHEVWHSEKVMPDESGKFALTISRRYFDPGEYEVRLYRFDDAGHLGTEPRTFAFTVPEPDPATNSRH